MTYSLTAKHKILSVTSELIRVDRVARILDVTKKRVYNLIAEGKLEAVKLGPRQTRVTRDSLESYLNRLLAHSRYERGIIESECE